MNVAPDVDVFEYARDVMRRLMQERGTTQMTLVPVLGMVQVRVSDRVRGRTKLTLADIHRLARYWGVDPREFFPTSVSESAWTRRTPGHRHLRLVEAVKAA
jgi:plasmid maintenance system antidote protein VapI